jgi:hypothetical protein
MVNPSLGLDYFSLDVNFLKDAKIIKLLHAYGPLGLSCYLCILINVYAQGYYAEYSINDLARLLITEIGGKYMSGKDKLQELILYMARIDLIDGELLSHNIITSKGIQKRFLLATKKRKSQKYTKYWLLDNESPSTDLIMNLEPPIAVCIEPSKEDAKRRRRHENHDKELSENAPKKHYLTSCLITYRYIDEYSLDLFKFNRLFEELCQDYYEETVYDAVRYLCNWASRASSIIYDPYNFFEISIKRNLEMLRNRQSFNFDEWMNSILILQSNQKSEK